MTDSSQRLSSVDGIIWDLDDTLYAVTEALHTSMRESAARAVVSLGHPITYEEALALAEESQKTHRLTVKMLMDQFNIDKRDLHLPFHAAMDHSVIVPCQALPAAFEALPTVRHALITHASREWALRTLDHLGIADFFDPKAVYGLEDLDFEHKHESDRATKTCLDAIGVDGPRVAFAEDRDWNLTIPHRLGLTTVLMDHPSQPRALPAHVHYRFDRAAAFLEALADRRLQKTA